VKIQTQARLLVTGIVMVPLLILLANLIYRHLVAIDYTSGLPAYEDISALIHERISVEDWESMLPMISRTRSFGYVTVFRNDYLVLYSTLPAFSPGVFATRESIQSMLEETIEQVVYIFAPRTIGENRIYFLIRSSPPLFRAGLPAFLFPFLVIFIIIIILTIFVICMSIVITRNITKSVEVLEDATRRIAEGELDFSVDIKGSNEITSLTNSLNKMRNTLKEADLRRSRFIMGITHDLKTPLALIKGYAEAIEDGIAEDPASISNATEIIAAKTDQLEGMINDLIDFVRMETGEWRAQLESINLADFLKKSAKIFNSDVELLQHTLTHDIALSTDICVPLDEKLTLRALENLIHNAVRYTPPGSIIRLDAKKLESAVKLRVCDNGPGIDKEDLPHIFEMFYRGSFSRREQGIGLGLAVVKWVIDYHGWSISVSSAGDGSRAADSDTGTCFIIAIPLA